MRVEVKATLLEWACRRGGLDDETLLRAFPKLPEWKAGTTQPTLKQLEKFAQKNSVPLGMLFLPSPPVEKLPISDFRTIKNSNINEPSQNLLETIYLCQQRQDWYSQYLRDNGFNENEFIGCVTIDNSVIEVAQNIREAVGFNLEERQKLTKLEDTLRFFIDQVSQLNILVMISGIVGSNTHRSLDPDEFRGFVLIDRFSPLIFINGKDTKSAQIFTLAHELAHIWLGSEGVSNVQIADVNNQDNHEIWCNQVAAELLVPLKDLQNNFNRSNSLEDELKRLAKFYKVSSLVISRRLYDLKVYNYQEFRTIYEEELDELQKLQGKSKQKIGGDFYRNLNIKVSRQFLQALVSSTLEGKTLFRDAFRLLSIKKSETFNTIANKLTEG
ncbi:ImmA/IrrE family metallo-endopeptidase [Crocosphaera sp.]|uniref:ImmA/IrrE family metallo-endopeptidase n=1 Tax=Crocosphaera sp. TaxID=2729996 RepID=UPI002612A3EB|nr:ImmA/IrrE family metallo-endopeptidase [Crocosphaera sp.]MDJ0580202.1 ImmA/IrrE family metallo-endopeptidase [Crocosphaera sp.]